jgi:two-component system sensor kinase FixL
MSDVKILIVEDDFLIFMHLREMLKLRGYAIRGPAASGSEAMHMADAERPDLIIMDIILEGDIDGINTASRIQTRLDIPVIYLTACADEVNLKRSQETVSYGYLIKPVKDYDLYSAIETALARHRQDKNIRKSEAFSTGLLTSFPIPIIVINPDGSVRYVNRAFESFTGFSFEEVVGLNVPYPWAREENGRERIGKTDSGTLSVKKIEYLRKKNSDFIIVETTVVPVSKGEELLYYLVIWEDLTVRRRLEEQVLDISERERIRIGHDLHDGIGQELTAVSYHIGAVLNKIHNKELRVKEEAESIMHMLDETRTYLRLLAKGLSPVNMDSQGIAIAVDELCRRAERIFGIQCTFHYDDISIGDNSKATHIYYIIQEALNNAVKHAKSKNVTIELKRHGRGINISVSDDGIGMPENIQDREGLGIIFMKYRVDIIGGVLDFKKGAPSGTVVNCFISEIE